MLKTVTVRATLLAACITLPISAYAIADAPKQVDIAAGDLGQALLQLSNDYGADLVYRPEQVRGLKTHGAHGSLTTEQAVTELLEGTKLKVTVGSTGALLIATPQAASSALPEGPDAANSADTSAKEGKSDSSGRFRVAQVDQATSGPELKSGEEDTKKGVLEEVVVTGTQIHGVQPTSRVATFTREDIQDQGFGTVQDFLLTLPQNTGAASANTIGVVTGGNASNNTTAAAGINLRGLGNNSTLVLLNGRRIAPGNLTGNFVDVSMIPLSAIDRIEVMPDGASALYGSDAVGGVVNFILRRDVEQAETTLRYTSVADSQRHEIQASQSLGHAWNGGAALLVYEYDEASALYASDRPYTSSPKENPTTLLPDNAQHSVLFSAQQDVGAGWQLFGQGLYSHRAGYSLFTLAPNVTTTRRHIDSYSLTGGAQVALTDSLHFELPVSYSATDTEATRYRNAQFRDAPRPKTTVGSVDPKLDGVLAHLPTGALSFAVGAQARRETFKESDPLSASANLSESRTVTAGFLEFHVPLIGITAYSSGASALDLELADRQEHYSDFGSTNNPKVGLLWRAFPGLKFHGDFAKSFVAPVLSDLNPVPIEANGFPGTDFVPGPQDTNGVPNVLEYAGGNPNLQPERATSYTFGVDYGSEGWKAYANYYHIRFTNQITNVQALFNFYNVFAEEEVIGPSVIVRNPSAALIQTLESYPFFTNFGVANLATIGAVVDSRQLNLSTSITDGLDFGSAYKMHFQSWTSEVGVDGTYIFKFDNQFSSTSPLVSLLSTLYNPVNLKLRGRVTAQRGPVSVSAFLNYVNHYENSAVNQPIASWTTLDLTGKYEFSTGFFSGDSLQVGVTNLTNRAPPYTQNAYDASGYKFSFDGVNANALGRVISAQISKRW